MRSIDVRVGTITASVLMTVLMFSGIALAQAEETGSEESLLLEHGRQAVHKQLCTNSRLDKNQPLKLSLIHISEPTRPY